MLWQKRALAKAGHLSQRCSADSTSFSQSRQRSNSVFPVRCSHQRRLGWCPLRNLTRSDSSTLLRVLFDLVCIGGVQIQKTVVAAREWSVFPMDHHFFGLSV